MHPRCDVAANQCPDLETLKQLISRKFAGQLPGVPPDAGMDGAGGWGAPTHWKFQVWLPDGLAPVQNDSEWAMALVSASNVDWMDGDLRVLVELEGTS